MSQCFCDSGSCSQCEPLGTRQDCYECAKREHPEGVWCQFCGRPNDFWDDCGWFCLWPNPAVQIGRVACRSCYDGEPGRKHIARYGVGER